MRYAVAAMALAFAATLAASDALPVTFTVPELKDLDGEAWGSAEKDGEIEYRTVLAEKKAVLKIPNWWGDTIRPPKGEVYVLEVSFKDTAKQPVSVLAHGGLGRYQGRSELHRIGGSGDGQWKVAQVPVSWDTIMLRQGSKDAELEFRLEKDEAPLPVAKLTVRKAKLPEDRIRYEAESRGWVKQVQAELAKTAGYLAKDQEAAVPEELKDRPLVPFVRPYYLQVHPNSAPQAGETGQAVKIVMARNEYEPGAFGVYAQQDLDGVTFTVSELKGAEGELACELETYTVEYALQTKARRDATSQWDAQRLWKSYPTPIAKGRSHWFWVSLRTLGEASKPGAYQGKITIRSKQGEAELPLDVTVLPITLPTMEEAGLRMGGCCTGLVTAGEMKTMAEHNHNMVNIWWAGVQPGMKKEGGKIVLDFYYLDDFMKLAKENGQGAMVWFLGGNPNGYPNTISIERDIYNVLHGDKTPWLEKQGTKEQRGKISEDVRPYYVQIIKDIVAHAKEKEWPELIFTPFDEPAKWAYPEPKADKAKYSIGCGPWIRDHFKAACALLHEAAPENKVYISMHRNFYREVHGTKGRVGEIFIPDVDIVCSNAIDEDNDLPEKVTKAGNEWWQYGMPYSRRYGYGFFFASWRSTGSLCWAYNWGPRLDVSAAPNWLYAWYSPFETILTPTYEEMREAWDDRRYLAGAQQAAKAKGADDSEFVNALLKDVRESEFKGGGGRDLVHDFWTEGKDPRKMDLWRKQLADKIVELQK